MRSSAAICRCSRFWARAGAATAAAATRTNRIVFLISVRCNHKVTPPVMGKRLFGLAGVEGELLAVADRAHPFRRDAERDQERFHRDGATFSESEVVLSRAAIVAVSFDGDHPARILLQH